MRDALLAVCLALALVGMLGCAGGGGGNPINTDEAAIRQAYMEMADSYRQESVAGFIAHISDAYLNDGVTKQEKVEFLSSVFDPSDSITFRYEYTIDRIEISGDTAQVWGSGTLFVRDTSTGEQLSIVDSSSEGGQWRKEGGVWRLIGNQRAFPPGTLDQPILPGQGAGGVRIGDTYSVVNSLYPYPPLGEDFGVPPADSGRISAFLLRT